jgi:hypothetical protein
LQRTRKYIALLLLAVFGFLLTPHELLHACVEHTDTCDVVLHSGSETLVSSLHQHCDVLQLATTTLYHTIAQFTFSVSAVAATYYLYDYHKYFFSTSPFQFLRGPPALF